MSNITFTPDLRQVTPIPISSSGEQDLQELTFRATFDSREAYEAVKKNGSRIEMWTNLPVVSSGKAADQGWHALAFTFLDEFAPSTSKVSKDVFSVLPPSAVAPTQDQASRSAFLTVKIPVSSPYFRGDASYAFTYRLVETSGAIRWLGQYGQNGVLLFQQKHALVDLSPGLAAGCLSVENEGRVVVVKEFDGAVPSKHDIGTLRKDLHWERWAIGQDGLTFSPTHIASPSSSIVLIPRSASHSIVPLYPLVLSTASPSKTSISITPSGGIVLHSATPATNATAKTLTTIGGCKLALNGLTQIVGYDGDLGYAILASLPHDKAEGPFTLNFVPLTSRLDGNKVADVRLSLANLVLLLPPSETGCDVALFHAHLRKSIVLKFTSNTMKEHLKLCIPRSGAQMTLSPLHPLPQQAGVSYQIGMVTPYSGAEVITPKPTLVARDPSEPGSVFPTPPPSPPIRNHLSLIEALQSMSPPRRPVDLLSDGVKTPEPRDREVPETFTPSPQVTSSPPTPPSEDDYRPRIPKSVLDIPGYLISSLPISPMSEIADPFRSRSHSQTRTHAQVPARRLPTSFPVRILFDLMVGVAAGTFFLILKMCLDLLGVAEDRLPLRARGRSGYIEEKKALPLVEAEEGDTSPASPSPIATPRESRSRSNTDHEETQSEATVVDDAADLRPSHSRTQSTATAVDHLKHDIHDLKQQSQTVVVRPPYLTAQLASKDISFLAYRTGPPSATKQQQSNLALTLDGKAVPAYSCDLLPSPSSLSDNETETEDDTVTSFMVHCPGFEDGVQSKLEISIVA